ncbi:MAG: hypothetical protein E3J35_05530 [Methanomassiliicoccales archaeon]|nr:MAG: hypothetical protein E3J35_05530 [Methanomassiliicoccales archaeon]
MRLFEALEKRIVLILLIFGLGALIVLLDYLNPFVDFFKTWDMYYVVNHLGWYMLPLVPAYLLLGFLVSRDDSLKIYLHFLWIPVVHYLLKGILFVYIVIQDPSILHVTGSWFGGYILDWRDFVFLQFAIFYFFMWSIGIFCIVLMTLGLGPGVSSDGESK